MKFTTAGVHRLHVDKGLDMTLIFFGFARYDVLTAVLQTMEVFSSTAVFGGK